MKYQRFSDAGAFYDAAFSVLLRDEAQNSLPLGNAILGKNGGEPDGWRNPQNWYMATVSDESGVVLTAIMTPPFNLTLYETDNLPRAGALESLCQNILAEGIDIPGVTCEKQLAERFAAVFCPLTTAAPHIRKNLRVYKLTQVEASIPRIGSLRLAAPSDLHFLPYWHQGFHTDCGMGTPELPEEFSAVSRFVSRERLFVLEHDGMPVSMAGISREIITGSCVGMVYTPPYLRAKGYAMSCVAQLSELILARGQHYASLFTNLANPTSNSIYQKIGYVPLCDSMMLKFEPSV